MQVCSTCNQVKDPSEYHVRKKNRMKQGVPFIYTYVPRICASCEHLTRKQYSHTEQGQESAKQAKKKYYSSNKGQQTIRAYRKSDQGRSVQQVYRQSEAGRIAVERYRSSDLAQVTRFILDTKKRATTRPDDPFSLTAEEWKDIKSAYRNTCAYCGKILRDDVDMSHADYPNIDHVIPTSRGGWTTNENVVPSCRLCNYRKGRKIRIPKKPIQENP